MTMAFETVEFGDAAALLAAFHPDGKLWGKASRNLWIFRGHGDAGWKLLPTAYRAECWAKFNSQLIDDGEDNDAEMRAHRETDYLRTFMNTADKAGLLLPDDSAAIRTVRRFVDTTWRGEWPNDELRANLALAQHHGVPTRLLDWSWKPLVALYFAVAAFVEERHRAEHACVWAFSTLYASPETPMPGQSDVRIVLVPAPQATNPNLSAQAGTFTLDLEPVIEPLEDVIARVDLSALKKSHSPYEPHAETPLLYQIQFPARLAPQVLRLLDYEGVNGASVYPGYDGVVRKMREHRWWVHKVPSKW